MDLEKSKNLMWAVIFVLIASALLDINITLYGTDKLGIDWEGNPYVKSYLINNPIEWIFEKYVSCLFVLGIGVYIQKHKDKKMNLTISFIFLLPLFFSIFVNLHWLLVITGMI